MDPYLNFLNRINQCLKTKTFVKLSLGNYKGTEADLKNMYVKPISIKRVENLSFVFRYKTKDITKNYPVDYGMEFLVNCLGSNGFCAATLFTLEANTTLQLGKKGQWYERNEPPTVKSLPTYMHDRQKIRKLPDTARTYLQALRISDSNGKIYKNAQNKWKQINHYLEILSAMLDGLPSKERLEVVDMGAGKGYLTFALYDYLQHSIKGSVHVTGVEYRQDLVDFCNDIAKQSGFEALSFTQGTIEGYIPTGHLDMLIALHACDTATDDAIAKGIQYGAELIVVAPCCHKQIRREMEQARTKNELDFLLQHGIFMERQAEMLTDGFRALIMEYFGYQTKVFQFIADTHTPKNILIVGIKKPLRVEKQQEILQKIATSKAYFGIGYHHLERLLTMKTLPQ
ncbi:class I SAM-dependent methyltransferase [Sphingobacterium suaedae]|uniref:Class I SAM-dependent methyltransferase n=1 Tax=Sphingobacterium suaedae TaxID=1686402 RepID=A0ABW5KI33_9SPHI